MVPCELCQQYYQPSHQDSLCGQNLAISLSVKVKRGFFYFINQVTKIASASTCENMCISGVHLTHQLKLQCDAELQKLYMHSQGPTNSKETLDLSVKSIIEKTVKGFEIDILTLETCVACIYNEVNPYLYSLLFSQTNGDDMLIIHSWPEYPSMIREQVDKVYETW